MDLGGGAAAVWLVTGVATCAPQVVDHGKLEVERVHQLGDLIAFSSRRSTSSSATREIASLFCSAKL